jgi:hypothetical protein
MCPAWLIRRPENIRKIRLVSAVIIRAGIQSPRPRAQPLTRTWTLTGRVSVISNLIDGWMVVVTYYGSIGYVSRDLPRPWPNTCRQERHVETIYIVVVLASNLNFESWIYCIFIYTELRHVELFTIYIPPFQNIVSSSLQILFYNIAYL